MRSLNETMLISWYGRCCFLVNLGNNRVLFDPYDKFCNVNIGFVDAEVLLISSTWHDHGHIGASPGAWVFSYSGYYNHLGLEINGFEVKEERGTPTVVFNVKYKDISITNFADMGVYKKDNFTDEQLNILKATNIAFIRSGHERVLDFCDPKIIIPEHYFPNDFIKNQVPVNLRKDFEIQNTNIDEMIKLLNLPLEEVDDFEYEADTNKVEERKIVRFMRVHSQVEYSEEPKFKKYW